MKMTLLVVRCKTEHCETDLKLREIPPDDPDRTVYRVPAISVVGDPGELACPACGQRHYYSNADVGRKLEEKAQIA